MQRRELPASLVPHFTVSDARRAGVTSGRLQASDLSAPFHGTRATSDPIDEARLRLLLAALPKHAFACGPTAAVVHGMPLPARISATAFTLPTVGVPHPANRIRRPEVVGRSLQVDAADLTVVRGIACTTPARTWVDLAAILTLPHLVAAADYLLSRRRRLVTDRDLVLAHRRSGRSRGATLRAQALELCRDGAESPRESELRVLLMLAGLPEPDANVPIYDGARFVARVDLLYREWMLIIEYDGEYHRDLDQWSRDQSRRAELESLGYRMTVVTARNFDDPAALVRRIRRLLAA